MAQAHDVTAANRDIREVAHEQRLPNLFPFPTHKDFFDLHVANARATKVISSSAGKLAYVPIPKNACTTLKIFFFELNTGHRFEEEFNRIHMKFDRRAVDFGRFANDREHFKFLVVRDPVERFISAFNSRVMHYKELSESWMAHHAPHEIAKAKQLGLKFDPAIDEFVARLGDYMSISGRIHHHFLLQHMFFNSCPAAFDKIYSTHQLAKLQKDVSDRLQRPVQFRKVQETKNSPNAIRIGDLSARDLSRVIRYYLPDYLLFGPVLDG